MDVDDVDDVAGNCVRGVCGVCAHDRNTAPPEYSSILLNANHTRAARTWRMLRTRHENKQPAPSRRRSRRRRRQHSPLTNAKMSCDMKRENMYIYINSCAANAYGTMGGTCAPNGTGARCRANKRVAKIGHLATRLRLVRILELCARIVSCRICVRMPFGWCTFERMPQSYS